VLNRLFFGFLLLLMVNLPVTSSFAQTELSWFKRNFIDPEDGVLDVSEWLRKGGFLPVPLVVTEPAVENGAGIALTFIGTGDPAADIPPDISGVAAIGTGNGSKVYAGFHEGTYLSGDLKLTGFLAYNDVNLDFYTGNGTGYSYNFEGVIASASSLYRLGQSDWFAGAIWRFQDSDVRLKTGTSSPVLPTAINTRLSGLGAVLEYDTLDNVLTPTNGISARFSSVIYDENIGSKFDFSRHAVSAFAYYSPTDRWTLGGKFVAETVNGDVPFYALPFVNLRGVPAFRFQGRNALSTEFEASYQFAKRWRAVGFAGAGIAEGAYAGSDEGWQFAYGAGIRYRIARLLGMDIGLDVARGPEETVVYLQFGRAWRRF